MLIISAKLRIFFVKTNFYVKIFMNNCIFNKKRGWRRMLPTSSYDFVNIEIPKNMSQI